VTEQALARLKEIEGTIGAAGQEVDAIASGIQLTCFTGTEVQTLTQKNYSRTSAAAAKAHRAAHKCN